MPKIIIAGGGHGGVVSAIKLAKEGYDVTIFEKEDEKKIGLPQTDAIDESAFIYSGIPIPEDFKKGKNEITFVPLEQDLGSLTIPAQSETSIIADRKELIKYLLSLARENGAEIRFNETVNGPIILGNRVVGIKTDKGEYYGDIVIDACGVNSPVRNKLPEYFGINRPIKDFDILYSYRAYFSKITSAPPPKTNYNIFFKDDGTVGFRWLITQEDRVDALICRFYKPDDSELSHTLLEMHAENPQMGTELIYGGSHSIIPVCQPLALLIADGYAAVGDSAFMTFSVKGSGIAYSMKAATMLCDTIIADTLNRYSRESLWEYEKRFFKEIGFSAAGIAIGKNLLPYMKAEDVNKIFKLNLVTSDELSDLWESKADAILNKNGLTKIKEKIRIVRDEPRLKELFGNLAMWMGRYIFLQTQFPAKYDNGDIEEWVKKYNNLFDSIRYEKI